jgi:hypothetical protein
MIFVRHALVTLRPVNLLAILAVMAVVLVLNLLAMLFGDRLLKSSPVASALGIVDSVLAILQVALGAQVVVDALRSLGFVGAGSG